MFVNSTNSTANPQGHERAVFFEEVTPQPYQSGCEEKPTAGKDTVPSVDKPTLSSTSTVVSSPKQRDTIFSTRASSSRGHTRNPLDIFSSSTELEKTVQAHQKVADAQELQIPNIFKYGIGFNPDPAEHDVYRTIVISCLPLNITLGVLLNQVRGGLIVDAKVLDTISVANSKTALVVFYHEHAARAYCEHTQTYPLTFAKSVSRVTLVSKPTWPIPISLQKAIVDHQHTRCLEVHKFPRQISPASLRQDLHICSAVTMDAIEYMAMRTDGILEIRFSAIKYAEQAYGVLNSNHNYRQCNTNFMPDPCAHPLVVPAGIKFDMQSKSEVVLPLQCALFQGMKSEGVLPLKSETVMPSKGKAIPMKDVAKGVKKGVGSKALSDSRWSQPVDIWDEPGRLEPLEWQDFPTPVAIRGRGLGSSQ